MPPKERGTQADWLHTCEGSAADAGPVGGISTLKSKHSFPTSFIVQELCESRGGRPGLSVLTSLLVSVDVKNY